MYIYTIFGIPVVWNPKTCFWSPSQHRGAAGGVTSELLRALAPSNLVPEKQNLEFGFRCPCCGAR